MAGPATATTQVEKQPRQHEEAFEIHRYADEKAARTAIEDRTVYGTVVVPAQGPELLTDSAASRVVAQLLQQAVARQTAASGAGVAVTLLKVLGLCAVTTPLLSSATGGRHRGHLADSRLGSLTDDRWAEVVTLALATPAALTALAGPLLALTCWSALGLGAVVLGNALKSRTNAHGDWGGDACTDPRRPAARAGRRRPGQPGARAAKRRRSPGGAPRCRTAGVREERTRPRARWRPR